MKGIGALQHAKFYLVVDAFGERLRFSLNRLATLRLIGKRAAFCKGCRARCYLDPRCLHTCIGIAFETAQAGFGALADESALLLSKAGVYMELEGEIDRLLKVGAVLPTITDVWDVVCSPALSVAVMTHSTISEG